MAPKPKKQHVMCKFFAGDKDAPLHQDLQKKYTTINNSATKRSFGFIWQTSLLLYVPLPRGEITTHTFPTQLELQDFWPKQHYKLPTAGPVVVYSIYKHAWGETNRGVAWKVKRVFIIYFIVLQRANKKMPSLPLDKQIIVWLSPSFREFEVFKWQWEILGKWSYSYNNR